MKLSKVERDAVSQGWSATHKITIPVNGGGSVTILVMLTDDGTAYDASEWLVQDYASYVVFCGEWLFHGEPFSGTVEEVKR